MMDVDIILKMSFFIRDLHRDIEKLHPEQQQSSLKATGSFTVYRGQGLSQENFDKMKQTIGGLMSFNNFLSTSQQRELSLQYAHLGAIENSNRADILFIMNIDPGICSKSSIPFVTVKDEGYFKDNETEILFTTHTVFRIDSIEQILDAHNNRLWQANLTLVGNDDNELNNLTAHLRDDVKRTTGWSRLGYIFIKLGESAKAKQLYEILLEKASSDEDLAKYNHQLGWVYYNMGEYSKALSSYERSLEIKKIGLPLNHPDLSASYLNIGNVYYNMGEYSKALSSHERSLEILKIVLPPNHPDFASSYNNIGNV
ncbi:unnamed protein product [Rotaria sp. Silwood2]|nr:unnamed protein product [Rotaria sp. Silwood2]CAF4715740.1 unnamed protein product [Rotaria sp. Silwood2]